MDRPILMALVDRSEVLEALRQDLTRRYGADYDVIAETSTTIGLEFWNGSTARQFVGFSDRRAMDASPDWC